MKALCGTLFFLLFSFQSVLSQHCDVVVTNPTALKNDLKAMLNNFEINFDGNISCSTTCKELERKIDRVDEKLDEKLDEMMKSIRHVISEQVSSLQVQLRRLHLPGLTPSQPATSCAEILQDIPGSPSGYYWIEANEGLPRRRYCNMNWSCGGVAGGAWMKVAELNMRNNNQSCPSGLRQRSDSNIRTCGRISNSAGCSSVIFHVNTLGYSKVCGKIRAYQYGTPDSFRNTGRGSNPSINTYYVDGISLTLGNPRRHLWTFAAALDEVGTIPSSNCPCTRSDQASRATQPPAFVGNDYFCDTASATQYQYIFYADDPLWDGIGCGPQNTCCTGTSPWFYRQFPQPTTDYIEMRVCSDQGTGNEDIAVETIDIYVQ